jgi:6-phosphogluconolactonase
MRSIYRAALLALTAGTLIGAQYTAFIGDFGTAIPGFRLDTATGKLTPLGDLATSKSPAWLTLSPNGKVLYAVNEQADGISAFSLDASGKLTLLNTVATKGKGPCHAAVDRTGKAIFVANYGSGSLESFPI